MGEEYIQVSALDSGRSFTLHVNKDWYSRVKSSFNKACDDNPEHTAKLYGYFLDADKSDLLNPKWWHQSVYGEKSDSREFVSIIEEIDPSDRLIAKHYVGNRSTQEIEKALEQKAVPEVQ